MKALRNFVDKIKPTFSEGGKLSALHSTFDAFETFLFVPNTVTKKGAHIRDCNDIKRVMIVMVVALLPALLFGMYNTGLQHARALGLDWTVMQLLVRLFESPARCDSFVCGRPRNRVRFRTDSRTRGQ